MIKKPSEPAPSQKPSFGRRIAKFLAWLGIFTFFFLLLSIFGLNYYLQSNKSKILEQLTFLNRGSISFQRVDINLYKDFPGVTISLQQVQVKDSLFEKHQIPFLTADEIRGELSLEKLWAQEVEIKTVKVINGTINLHTDSNGYSLLNSLIPDKNSKKANEESWLKEFKLKNDRLKVKLSNVFIGFTNRQKKSSIKGLVEKLTATVELLNNTLKSSIDMEIALEEMVFNEDKGTWLRNSRLVGKPVIEFNNGRMSFAPFDLLINDEKFSFNGHFDFQKKSLSKLVLENKYTRFAQIFPLLPKRLQKKVIPYQIKRPFYSKTTIKGFFRRGEEPIVNIDFRIDQNELKIFHVDLHQADLKGRFVNRLFDDKRAFSEDRKRVKLEVQEFSCQYKRFKINSPEILFTSTPKTGPQIAADLQVQGLAADISRWLATHQFFFDEGNFNLTARVQGPINDFNQIMINSNAKLDLEDILVYYLPAEVHFPFKQLVLSKKSGDADFKLLSSTPRRGHNFLLKGFLKNLPALLLELKDQRVNSKADFVADRISWRDFLDWFGKNGRLNNNQVKSEEEKKRTMKQTISGIQNKFHPRLSLSIDTLAYYDLLQLNNFFTNIHFEDEHYLVLEKTHFEYDQGSVDFSARLDIRDSILTPFEFELRTRKLNLKKLLPPLDHFNIQLLANLERHPEDLNLSIKHRGIINDQQGLMSNTSTGEISFDIEDGAFLSGIIIYEPDRNFSTDSVFNKSFTSAKIKLEGDPSVFNDFLKTEQFFFSEGRFFLDLDYKDDPANLEEIINNGAAHLKIHESNVHYKPAGVDFPLTQIDLKLNADTADFDLFLRSDSLQQEIQLTGTIQNLSELVIGNTGKSIKTTVDINSPKLIWNQFIYLFAPEPDPEKEQNFAALKTTIKGMFNTFDPTLRAQTDTFVFTDQFVVQNFETGIYMDKNGEVVLDKTAFNFHDGSMSFKGRFDLDTQGPLPFQATFSTQELDVEKLLHSLDFVGLPSLRSIKKLSGRITMDFDLTGLIAEDGNGLIPEATKGYLDVELKEVELRGMAPLDSLAARIRMKERFADIRFAPIETQISINGLEIEIPLMEIQSNAINLFLEGTLSYGDKTNIWVSVPWDNLKKADRTVVPAKRGYAASKRKLYFEVTSDEAGNNQFKLRLSKRRFYKQRGILKQYRKDKKRYRKLRREMRRRK